MREPNIKTLISDLVSEGKKSTDELRMFEKKELLAAYLKKLTVSEQWELIVEADMKDLIPELFSDILIGNVTEEYFINKLTENAWEYCEGMIDAMMEIEHIQQNIKYI